MRDEEGNVVKRELHGVWAEARTKLDAAAADLIECAQDGLRHLGREEIQKLRGEPFDGRRSLVQHREIKALDSCLERVREAQAYLDAGEPGMAATELVAATAYFSLSCQPSAHDQDSPAEDTWSGQVDLAKNDRRAEGPWVRALRTAAEQIRALHPILTDRGTVRTPACVDPPALQSGPGKMTPVGTVLPRALGATGAVRPRRRQT